MALWEHTKAIYPCKIHRNSGRNNPASADFLNIKIHAHKDPLFHMLNATAADDPATQEV